MQIILSFLIGYISGSIPTAYLLVKRKHALDITSEGSGNVGALNSYEVSKSKITGISVLLIDFLKGLAAVYISGLILGNDFIIQGVTLIAAVLAHCYSPWINFKGGRGLATAAGGMFLLSIPILVTWFVIWIIAYAFRKNIHFGNFAATILTAFLSFSSAKVLMKYTSLSPETEMQFGFIISLIMFIILLKHIKPIKEYFKTQNKKVRV